MAEDAASRARRLLSLLPFLNRQRALPVSQLANALGVDERTITDDLTLLSLCGADERDPSQMIGVLVEDGIAEVFADLPGLERPVRLTAVEARAVASALGSIGLDPSDALMRKLEAFAAQSVDLDEVVTTVRTAFAQGGHAHVVAALNEAAELGVAARIGYVSSESDAVTERTIHPYALYPWRDAWYLLAYCERAGEERTFRVDRITSIHLTAEHFERPAGLAPVAVPLPNLDGLPRAMVRFAGEAPDLTSREWPGAEFRTQEDGTVLATIPYAGPGWISRKVTARLGDAEVISPAELRAVVAEAARKMLSEL